MRALEHDDLQWILRLAPEPLLLLMKSFPAEVFVAGGFVRAGVSKEDISDIDVFAPTAARADVFALKLANGQKDSLHRTMNAITVKGLRYPIQFVHRWSFSNPLECIESFDFTIACAAFWYDKGWQSVREDSFYADLAAKRLVYRRPKRNEDAGGSMLRVLKFYQRGYRIGLDSLGNVIARMTHGADAEHMKKLKDADPIIYSAALGEEAESGRKYRQLLKEVDPGIDPSHVAHLPSSDDK